MELFCIRHGQAESNIISHHEGIVGSDLALTPEGYRQVRVTAAFLGQYFSDHKQAKPAVVHSSPYQRARQTAAVIADELALPVQIDSRLQEAQKGDWHGKRVADILEYEQAVSPADRPYFQPPSGENWLTIADRMAAFVLDRESSDEHSVLLVSHDSPIECLIGKLCGQPVAEWDTIEIHNASVSRLYQDGDIWQLDDRLTDYRPYAAP